MEKILSDLFFLCFCTFCYPSFKTRFSYFTNHIKQKKISFYKINLKEIKPFNRTTEIQSGLTSLDPQNIRTDESRQLMSSCYLLFGNKHMLFITWE